MLLCTSFHCLSQEPTDYLSSRKWVEDWVGSTNQTPEAERIFVATRSPAEYAVIVQYRKGITLREIIDQTRFWNAKLMVYVMCPNKSESKFFQNVTPLATPDFEVKKGDMIWLIDVTPPLLI